MALDEIREKIDRIDRQILELFCSRMELVKGVAEYKIDNSLPVFHPERERQILSGVRSLGGEEYGGYAEEVFQTMMEVSRQMQQKMIASRRGQDQVPDGESLEDDRSGK